MKRTLMVAASLMLVAAPAAWAQSKGSSILAIEFTTGVADVTGPVSGGYLSAGEAAEVGLQAQFWRFMSDDYALTVSAGGGMSNETDKPGPGALVGSPDLKTKTSSFNVRIGGDRVVKVGSRALMYGGPGVEYWSGKGKFESGSTSTEGPSTTRIGLSARIGAIMTLNEKVGLTTHVGTRLGYASAEDAGAKTTWWPSSFEGAMGVSFMMGGSN